MRYLHLITLFLLSISASKAAEKEVVILLPIEVDQSLQEEAGLLGTAVQQALSERFSVFYGPAVEEKLEVEYSKENCSALSCAQNLAIEFNGELIANTSVQKVDTSFVIQLQINNVVTGQITDSLLEVCENCSKLQMLAFTKRVVSKAFEVNAPVQKAKPIIRTPQKPDLKALNIGTTPTRARVRINGNYRGTTPLGLQAPVGEKIRIQITKRGYEPREFVHTIGENDGSLSNLPLTEKPEQTKRVRVPMGF